MSGQYRDVEILWLAKIAYQSEAHVFPHRHPEYHQIYHIIDGTGTFQLGELQYPFKAGMFFLIHPDEIHGMDDFKPNDDGVVNILELKFHVRDLNISEDLDKIKVPAQGPADLSEDFLQIFKEAMEKDFYYEERLPHLMAAWLYRFINICKNYGYSKEDSSVIPKSPATRIRRYIDEHYQEDISLDQIAQSLDYSKNYLCRLFREGAGITINEYINNVRISAAKQLLQKMRYSIDDVSQMCGFHSVHYFTKVFKDIVGVPPGAFRRSELVGFGNGAGPMLSVNTAITTERIFTYSLKQ